MILIVPHRLHPIEDQFELSLRSDSKELIELLKELQTAQKWGYAKQISAVDVVVAIATIEKEKDRARRW